VCVCVCVRRARAPILRTEGHRAPAHRRKQHTGCGEGDVTTCPSGQTCSGSTCFWPAGHVNCACLCGAGTIISDATGCNGNCASRCAALGCGNTSCSTSNQPSASGATCTPTGPPYDPSVWLGQARTTGVALAAAAARVTLTQYTSQSYTPRGCNQADCCCFTSVTIADVGSAFEVSGSVAGQCGGTTSAICTGPIPTSDSGSYSCNGDSHTVFRSNSGVITSQMGSAMGHCSKLSAASAAGSAAVAPALLIGFALQPSNGGVCNAHPTSNTLATRARALTCSG